MRAGPTKAEVLKAAEDHQNKPEAVREKLLLRAANQPFFNASPFSLINRPRFRRHLQALYWTTKDDYFMELALRVLIRCATLINIKLLRFQLLQFPMRLAYLSNHFQPFSIH